MMKTGSGIPATRPLPMARNAACLGSMLMGNPLLYRSAHPRAINMLANVMMNGGIRVRAASNPFTRPTSETTAMPAMTANGIGSPFAPDKSTKAAVEPASARSAPTERSIPPETMTRVIPNARMALTEICWARSMRLLARRNVGTKKRNSASSSNTATINGQTLFSFLMWRLP